MKTWQEVEGFFNYPHVYSEVIKRASNGETLVEVGSWKGQSLAFLGQGLKAKGWSGRLVAVDTFKGETNQPAHYKEVEKYGGSIRSVFEQNMKDCEIADMVEILESDSVAATSHFKDGECSFVYIDAAHDFDSVLNDILAWLPKMRPGGMIAGHDYQDAGVRRAVYECLAGIGYFVSGPCWLMNTPPDMTPQDWREAIAKGKEQRAKRI